MLGRKASSIRCLTSCKLSEFCQSPGNCFPWTHETVESLERRGPRWMLPLIAAAVAVILLVSFFH